MGGVGGGAGGAKATASVSDSPAMKTWCSTQASRTSSEPVGETSTTGGEAREHLG
jgi:hypothetical protein